MDGELPRCAGLAGAGRGRNGAQLSGRVVRGASRSRCGGIQDSEPGVLQARQRGTSWLRGESSGRRAERQRPPWWEDPRVTGEAKGQRLEPREAHGKSGDAHRRALGAGEREGPPLRGVSSVKETRGAAAGRAVGLRQRLHPAPPTGEAGSRLLRGPPHAPWGIEWRPQPPSIGCKAHLPVVTTKNVPGGGWGRRAEDSCIKRRGVPCPESLEVFSL